MNFRFHTLSFSVLSALLALSAVACSDDDDSSDGSGGGSSTGGSAATGSELEAKLSACPVVSTSSDPAASTCLVGTYSGKTLAGEDCSLEVKADNAYEYTSPTLTVSYSAPADATLLFDHANVQGYEGLKWIVSDPIASEAFYDLDFTARFGTGVPDTDRKIEIEVTENGADAKTSSSCIVTF